jgi:DNA-binding LytR/AlgR family response regulator
MAADFIYLNSRDEFLRIDISRIVYFEADGNYTRIVLSNGLVGMVCMSLTKMEQYVGPLVKKKGITLARIGKRFIINLSYVYKINILQQELVLSDQRFFSFTLNLSRDALKNLRDVMTEYLKGNAPSRD